MCLTQVSNSVALFKGTPMKVALKTYALIDVNGDTYAIADMTIVQAKARNEFLETKGILARWRIP